jgi:hypothetical protein
VYHIYTWSHRHLKNYNAACIELLLSEMYGFSNVHFGFSTSAQCYFYHKCTTGFVTSVKRKILLVHNSVFKYFCEA